ncbi:N-acetyltransferase family protein [Knoellia sp. CPCC 206453]|uniref:GNAT family N-acetyltransferase n=1 Tax=Knoellia pratensis TaxID=3404796 RepID=UPI00361C6195
MIRPATPADVNDLIRFRVLMFEAMGTAQTDLAAPKWLAATRAWFEKVLARDDACILVAEVEGQVVSCGVGEVKHIGPSPGCPNGLAGVINNIVTDVEARGQGWGRRITEDLVDWFDTETDARRVDLYATPDGARIYRDLGFTEHAFPAMQRPSPPRAR